MNYLVYVNDERTRIARSELSNPMTVAEKIFRGDIPLKPFEALSPWTKDEMHFDKAKAFYIGEDRSSPESYSAVYGDGNGHTFTIISVEDAPPNPFADLSGESCSE
ncbi:hypothetical protein AGMMS49587_16630 [Spirochaetia bacterium]|nr:hypothetical protein AGMMS49587_16630 [Spirochaetia bacterium]